MHYEHNTHFKTVVSSLGCFHDLHWPLNCINLLLSHKMVSFTALFCLHQFLMYKEHWSPHCFCSLQHWCVLMNFFIKYQQSLSLTYLLYLSLSDTYIYSLTLCVSVSLSNTHKQTIFLPSHSYPHVDWDDSWNRSQTGWLSSIILPLSFKCLHLTMSFCRPISNHYLRVRAVPFKFQDFTAFQDIKNSIQNDMEEIRRNVLFD